MANLGNACGRSVGKMSDRNSACSSGMPSSILSGPKSALRPRCRNFLSTKTVEHSWCRPGVVAGRGRVNGEHGLAVTCIECGVELLAERAELGYKYCTKEQCQAKHHQGLTITTVGVNKSADTFIVGDPEEIRRRAEAGEFGKKDSSLGVDYRSPQTGVERPSPARSSGPVTRKKLPPRPWSREQEKIVRLYNGMGLTPRQIVERARANTPQLGITESLVTKIMCSPPRR